MGRQRSIRLDTGPTHASSSIPSETSPVAISCFGVRIVQHPDYDRDTLVNDVAIIFLASDSAYPPISRLDHSNSE